MDETEIFLGLVILVAICCIIYWISKIVENRRYLRSHPLDLIEKEVSAKNKELEDINYNLAKQKKL